MKEPVLPIDPDLLVRPLHLAGPGTGTDDTIADLVDHFGWRLHRNPHADPILRCPQQMAWLARRVDLLGDSPGWEVDFSNPTWTRDPWWFAFDDATPGEVTATVLPDLAHRPEHSPGEAFRPAPGWDGALALLREGGWALGQRDGHDVLLAPDRLAALTRSLHDEGAPTVLTGAAAHGTWKVTFSSHAPGFLLHSAAAALLRPAVRSPDQVPAAHRERMSLEPLPPSPGPRVLVSPRYLAGPGARGPQPPSPSALWHATEPGQVVSSCGRARVEASPEGGLRVYASPHPLDINSAWRARFTPNTPVEITDAWLEDFLTDSVAADLDLGTAGTFVRDADMMLGEAVEPLTSAGWSAYSDATCLRLLAPGGYASASIPHGRAPHHPSTTTAEALASPLRWGADFDVTAPTGRWHAHLTDHTPPHLVRALISELTDPAALPRDSDRIPRQLLTSVRLASIPPDLSPAAAASRVRSLHAGLPLHTDPSDPQRSPAPTDLSAGRAVRTR
ncbi:hypothetical protein [Kitasatospora phosalacinea]|uniref:DUF317 domain-containing protein n=1 Tax=Kitasatospora phosalacinea TaxID=2065 RepID=A0A9W6PNP7_9ACTN|nr:hypothetical protein [Kitasatospora phosalacinea]GLW58204.1 hypothetical protein Kpho01_62150 [Kitasatospora phosalacinea]